MNILDFKSERIACVYKLTFPDGKCYIGQTRCLRDRVRLYEGVQYRSLGDSGTGVDAVIARFGIENVELEVLCRVSIDNREDLLVTLGILEIKHIRDAGSLVPNGYNSGVGGEVLGLPSEFFECLSGVSLSGGSSSKAVLCYALDGSFVEEYSSIERCAYAFGVDSGEVSSALSSGRQVFRGEYMLRYKKYSVVPERILPYESKRVDKVVTNVIYEDVVKYRDRVCVTPDNPILKYNLSGEYCGTYDSLVDAAVSVGLNSVTRGGVHRGYLFLEYDSGDIEQNIGRIRRSEPRKALYSEYLSLKRELDRTYMEREIAMESARAEGADFALEDRSYHKWCSLKNDFKVGQYKLSGELFAVYDSIRDASESTGVNYANIWANVFGRTKKCAGFRWRACDDNGEIIKIEKK